MSHAAGRRGGHRFALGIALRMLGFVVLAIVLVVLVGSLGATVIGVATAPLPVLLVGVLAVLALLVGVSLAWRALRRAGAPLDRLIDAAGRVESGDYSARVAEDGPRDLRSLERAFNQMSARLEEGDQRRRSFLAELSHELRTPLTVMRAQLEAIGDGIYPADAEHLGALAAQTQLMERLVEDLRTLALAESGALVLRREPVDLAGLAAATVGSFRASAAAKGVTLAIRSEAGLTPLAADPARLRSVIGNLLTNALRHTPAGGSVVVTVGAEPDDWQRVEVQDTGSGIPADLLPRAFDRFVRGPGSEGTGLGLAIARDLVTAHGGRIRAELPAAGGTRVVVELPGSPGGR